MMTLDDFRKGASSRLTLPIVRLLARSRATPNAVTWAGFAVTVVAAVLAGADKLVWAGIVVLVAGFFDMLDGALARHTSQTTRFGGILDSSLDRVSEAAVLIGLLVFYSREQSAFGVLLAGLAILGSFMVSYVRARAEGAGLKCKVGIFTRPERVILLALGLLLSAISYVLLAALAIIVLLSFITTAQRLLEAWHQTKAG